MPVCGGASGSKFALVSAVPIMFAHDAVGDQCAVENAKSRPGTGALPAYEYVILAVPAAAPCGPNEKVPRNGKSEPSVVPVQTRAVTSDTLTATAAARSAIGNHCGVHAEGGERNLSFRDAAALVVSRHTHQLNETTKVLLPFLLNFSLQRCLSWRQLAQPRAG